MFQTIWERYLFRQFTRIFFLFLFCFYGLYVLIDYASHASLFANHHIKIAWQEIVRYYLFVFSSRAEILLPVALLIALVQTCCSMNSRSELVAYMAGGFSLKTLMKPFLVIGLACVFLMYANEQFLLPEALRKLRRIEDATKSQKKRALSTQTVNHLILEDGSLFIFQDYDTATERFFDAYWIQSIDQIYRMKYLSPEGSAPLGYFVDSFARNTNGELLQVAADKELIFPEMKFNRNILQSTIIDPDVLSLMELSYEIQKVSADPDEKESKILTAYYWKLMMPWLCLLAILAPAPFCVKFSRHPPVFMIYVCTLFGLIAFYMFMDAAQVVAKRHVMSPFWAICGPFFAMFGLFGWRFVNKM